MNLASVSWIPSMSATKAETAPLCCGARKRQETILDSLSTVCIGTCAHFDFHAG